MTSLNIFLDTSEIISSNFNFNSKLFHSLRSLCNSGHVTIILTDITFEEIKANLLKSITEAKSIIKKASSKVNILKNLDDYEFLFKKFDKEFVFQKLLEQITIFIQEFDVKIIKATEISPKEIFHNYFKCEPPFGEGKKKSEFPDAFVIAALFEWCERNNEKMFIVSKDSDFKSAVANKDCMEYFSSLSELIEDILSKENIIINIIHEQLIRNREMILNSIKESIIGYEMIVEDADPDAEAFIDDVLSIELYNESVINVSGNIATIEAVADTLLSINVNCYNPDSWYKDSEDGTIYYWDKIEDIFERDLSFNIEFDLQFDKNNIEELKITRTVINKDDWLTFYLDEDAKSFYK